MCDTQVLLHDGQVFFAKNSDREASEAQIIVRIAPAHNDPALTVKTTYQNIPQNPNRHGVILSKPHWMWGAEMGANDQGVVIGNEAVVTRLVERQGKALLGMDLLRLGLERGGTAREALEEITRLLVAHGQGGPAGYRDKSFRYDNSFIIADATEAWVLETAGRFWVAKKVRTFSAISNRLSIGCDYDLAREGVEDFAREYGRWNGRGDFHFAQAFDTHFLAIMGQAKNRQLCSEQSLERLHQHTEVSIANMAANLRAHKFESDSFARHGNGDVCMHAGGLLRPSQTCGSMIARLATGAAPQIMLTGTSAPCLSLFSPIDFDFSTPSALELTANHSLEDSRWHHFEPVHRHALFDPDFRNELRKSRDLLERRFSSVYEGKVSMVEANQSSREWLEEWHRLALKSPTKRHPLSPYAHFWKALNIADEFA